MVDALRGVFLLLQMMALVVCLPHIDTTIASLGDAPQGGPALTEAEIAEVKTASQFADKLSKDAHKDASSIRKFSGDMKTLMKASKPGTIDFEGGLQQLQKSITSGKDIRRMRMAQDTPHGTPQEATAEKAWNTAQKRASALKTKTDAEVHAISLSLHEHAAQAHSVNAQKVPDWVMSDLGELDKVAANLEAIAGAEKQAEAGVSGVVPAAEEQAKEDKKQELGESVGVSSVDGVPVR